MRKLKADYENEIETLRAQTNEDIVAMKRLREQLDAANAQVTLLARELLAVKPVVQDAPTPAGKIAVDRIVIDRAEGLTSECNGPQTFKTYADAERELQRMAITAPATGGYNKCDFTVYFADGVESYSGRIDLQRQHIHGYSIREHIAGYLRFLMGERKPSHLTAEQYERYHSVNVPASDKASYREFLNKYDVEAV